MCNFFSDVYNKTTYPSQIKGSGFIIFFLLLARLYNIKTMFMYLFQYLVLVFVYCYITTEF